MKRCRQLGMRLVLWAVIVVSCIAPVVACTTIPTPTPDPRLSCAEFRQEYDAMFGRMVELTRDQTDTLEAIYDSVRMDAASAEDYSDETTALFRKLRNGLEAERDEVWRLAELEAPTERINERAVAFAQAHDRFLDASWEVIGDPGNPTLTARTDALMEMSMTASERLDAAVARCQTQ